MAQTAPAATKDQLINEFGAMILADAEYVEHPWTALSIVVSIGDGQRSANGYRYLPDGTFQASLPKGRMRPFYDKLAQLRETMMAEIGAQWHQCLIQIWQPGPQIKVLFEYDDPTRWSIKEFSMDMSPYANSIKPPIG